MEVQTNVAAPSAAGETPQFTQFNGWDDNGDPVVMGKETPEPEVAEAAAADTSKETKADDGADTTANKPQTRRKPDAEARIRELTTRTKELERALEEARKLKETQADSSTARQPKAEPEAGQQQVAGTRPKPDLNALDKDGKRIYDSYEAFTEDLVDWKAEQKLAERERTAQAEQRQKTVVKQLEEARGRYENFDTVTGPLVADLMKPDIPREVFAVMNESPVLADVLYAIGGTAESRADFLKACRENPSKAMRVALLVEQEVTKELSKGKTAAPETRTETTPVTPKPKAPKPPAEVGGRGSAAEDPRATAAKTGDFRAFEAEQTRRALASRR